MFSKTTFWKYFEYTKDSVDIVYAAHQEKVLDVVRSKNEHETGLNLAADGSCDSRGYSALIGKAVVADLATKLVLHTEVLHRSETDNISGKMEVEGIRRMPRWIVQQGIRINSLTTDRSRNIGAMLNEMRPESGPITHFYDGWHLTPETGRYTRCSHRALKGSRPEIMVQNSKAFAKFRAVILNHRFQGDLVKASPYGGTSVCEAKNALDRIYCRKEIF
ncbi:hypothetical protein OESDEN_06180 [Oesophagostomum dentatum]|uniref:Uncharacterized protein n=1 Tax=Oesophagostomum dentatum TaxID=61180 RepID=A0A0B1T9H3_OESDE|nr:hypothetical protein OESDEN_06180 [Oesophagostomum dentatum]